MSAVMSDPLGLISTTGTIQRDMLAARGSARDSVAEGGPSFKDLLQEQIQKVNNLQQDAQQAVEDLATGRRDDVESVLLATQKADTAFKLLLQVRNKVMDAYDEVKQIRV
jgi:flagellar hook-basal body complex protein FliE